MMLGWSWIVVRKVGKVLEVSERWRGGGVLIFCEINHVLRVASARDGGRESS